jgi:hypothetical protein
MYAFNYFQVDSSVAIIKRRIKKRISMTRLTYIQCSSNMGTLLSIMNHDGIAYSEGKGILTSKATGEMATYTFQAI